MVLATTTVRPFFNDAINDYLNTLAAEAGYISEPEETDDDDGNPIIAYSPSIDDCIMVARQPVTIAAILNDLCRLMETVPPATVTAALTDSEPY